MPIVYGGMKLPFRGCDKRSATIFARQISAAKFVKQNFAPFNFFHLNFQLAHPNRSNSVSSHKYTRCILSLFPNFSSRSRVPLLSEPCQHGMTVTSTSDFNNLVPK